MVPSNRDVYKRKQGFVRRVVSWGRKNLRDFPWRNHNSPFRVFVAEILLKRTTSKAAERAYGKFLEEFPDIKSLAVAKAQEIEEVLRPIGLYKQRSKGLKEAAKYIMEECDGQIPSTYDDLLRVPHVGPYTAGATISFGFGKPAPIVDSNVRRVVSRVFSDILGDNPSDRELKDFLERLVPKKEHKLFNWGLIDLGFLICSYNFMKHSECPLMKMCCYYRKKH